MYLTGKGEHEELEETFDAINLGRPKFKVLFKQMRLEAIQADEPRVAVCVCAPPPIVAACKSACAKFSDCRVKFDFHQEIFD